VFDLFIIKPESARLVKVRQTRYRINPEPIYVELLPECIRMTLTDFFGMERKFSSQFRYIHPYVSGKLLAMGR
jgi:hypothetical protein